MTELERRARMHAALGEPVRLAVVDRLALGDISPGELGKTFDLATNLLSHHLRVLEGAGLIRRVRSEGDRRRSYVQLVLDDPVATGLTTGRAPTGLSRPRLSGSGESSPDGRVVFVCTQNSARSQLARAAWARASDVPTASAGTRPTDRIHPRAVQIGRRHSLALGPAGPAPMSDVVRPGDLVVAVCDSAFEELPPTEQPALHWAVPDPARLDTDEAFEDAYQQICRRIELLAVAVATRL